MKTEYNIHCGNYRHFVVIANSKKQARQRFIEASKLQGGLNFTTYGFSEKDITNITKQKNGKEQ